MLDPASPPTLFHQSVSGRRTHLLPPATVPRPALAELFGEHARAQPAALPAVSEFQTVRHYTRLAHRNMSIDGNFYPLGSCTMKYNPRVHEELARLAPLANAHPYQGDAQLQGFLRLLKTFERWLIEISGLDAVSLHPAAGAHGEFTGMMCVAAHHRRRGDAARREVLIPDSAHGTNPATCSMLGFTAVEVKTNARGRVDLDHLRALVGPQTAGMMITNPSTLGLFEDRIAEIAEILHAAGAMLYMDGANMNALAGIARPGDFGVDVMHFNVHKTFSQPHGGGGPGSGPIAVCQALEPYLPLPRIVQRKDGALALDAEPERYPLSVGKLRAFFGSGGVYVRVYCYLRRLGARGVRRMSEAAVLAANYLRVRLADDFPAIHDEPCMHEFVTSDAKLRQGHELGTTQIGKRLLDYGIHAPTIHFPLTVSGALMIEPTETESLAALDAFVAAMREIARECRETPELVASAPHTMPVSKLDEAAASKHPVTCYQGQ